MKLFSTIKSKLIVFALCISLVPIAIITAIYYYSSSSALKRQILTKLQVIAESRCLHILTFIDAKKERVLDFSSDGLIRERLEKAFHHGSSISNSAFINKHLLMNKMPLDRNIVAIVIVDKYGKVFSSTSDEIVGKDMSNQEEFIQLINKSNHNYYIGQPHYSSYLKRNCFFISATLNSRRTRNTLGAIIVAYELTALHDITTDSIGLGNTGEVYLVNKDKVMLTKSKFQDSEPLKLVVDTEPVRKIVNEGKETTGIYPDYRGVPVIGASKYMREYGWTLLVEMDKAVAFAPIKTLGIGALVVGLIAAATVTVMGIIFTFAASTRIKKLASATERFASGELDYRVKVSSVDEIGILAMSFNSMAAKLANEIGEHKRVEKELLESEEKFRCISASAPDAIIMLDKEGNVSYWNESAEKIFGYSKKETFGKKLNGLIIPERYCKDHVKGFKQFSDKGQGALLGKTIEIEAVNKDGTEFPIELSLSAVKLKGNWNAIGIIRNINERRKVEDELRKAHAQNEQLIAAIPSILIYIDDNDRVIGWNKTAEKVFGIRSADVIGRPFSACDIQWDDKDVVKQILDCRNTAQPTNIDDVRFKNLVGKASFLGITVNPIGETQAKQLALLIIGSDITQRKILESQLVQAQKLESIGQLAAGIAHEINTPTQYVGDNTHFLRDAFEDLRKLISRYKAFLEACKTGGVTNNLIQEVEATEKEVDVEYLNEEIPKAIQQSQEGIGRVTKIVHAMKEFSHPGTDEKTLTDINKAIESTITVTRNEWKYVAEMLTIFDTSLPRVLCQPDEFNQAILNIIVNSAHAISSVNGNGIITVSTQRDGDWVEIRIQDTGTGIPEAIRSKIFDPFFTTKEVGKGTGQGLAIAHDIVVKKHGGTIRFETVVDRGTTFIVRIPIGNNHQEKGDADFPTRLRMDKTG